MCRPHGHVSNFCAHITFPWCEKDKWISPEKMLKAKTKKNAKKYLNAADFPSLLQKNLSTTDFFPKLFSSPQRLPPLCFLFAPVAAGSRRARASLFSAAARPRAVRRPPRPCTAPHRTRTPCVSAETSRPKERAQQRQRWWQRCGTMRQTRQTKQSACDRPAGSRPRRRDRQSV